MAGFHRHLLRFFMSSTTKLGQLGLSLGVHVKVIELPTATFLKLLNRSRYLHPFSQKSPKFSENMSISTSPQKNGVKVTWNRKSMQEPYFRINKLPNKAVFVVVASSIDQSNLHFYTTLRNQSRFTKQVFVQRTFVADRRINNSRQKLVQQRGSFNVGRAYRESI